jgi:hypothetical protein
MNIPDHFSESLVTVFWVKIFKFFDADPGIRDLLDPGSGMKKFGSGIRYKHPGSATLEKSKTKKNIIQPYKGTSS